VRARTGSRCERRWNRNKKGRKKKEEGRRKEERRKKKEERGPSLARKNAQNGKQTAREDH
jgi:hypothetical protein